MIPNNLPHSYAKMARWASMVCRTFSGPHRRTLSTLATFESNPRVHRRVTRGIFRPLTTDRDKKESSMNPSIPDESPSPASWTIPGAQTGGRKLAVIFTCTVCETRSVKQFTEQAYHHGVVLARCPGCQNLHLIADRLGYFDERPMDLETIAAQTGQTVRTIQDQGVTEIDLEALIGKERMEKLVQMAEEASLSKDTKE